MDTFKLKYYFTKLKQKRQKPLNQILKTTNMTQNNSVAEYSKYNVSVAHN